MAAVRNIGKVFTKSSILFLCDMQEKFRPMIKHYPQIIEVSSRMLKAARILQIPVVTTEQYPKGLGLTVPELGVDREKDEIHAKTCFSMLVPKVEKKLDQGGFKSVIICGIETQACIQNTTLDLLERGLDVHVIADGCSSRSMLDRMYAFDRMKQSGAFITTSEAMILQLVGDFAHPNFKECQKLIKDSAPTSGLLPESQL
ncbi:isochorismatase domain-containing protein 2-like [Apostichopus japonicus]|uniref:isochorismatase domain-containing protein 2-like n=1 Tax=Stichopus japonicus TaxID=307972 RepID=UPI003AB173D8